ncbi:MAG: hypothetical protein ACK4TP_13720 [Hyphomicrobium sp.]|jgi:hypothetical protein
MDFDEAQPDLLSPLRDLDLVRHLIADLHDDLSGKIVRFRQLVDLSGALGSSGTMLFGGETTLAAWREARWCYIHGNYMGTVMLCQGLIEHLLAAFLQAGLLIDDMPARISFSDTLRRCEERGVFLKRDGEDLRRLMGLRNPLSHFRNLDDPSNLSRRVLDTMLPAGDHLHQDATFAIGLAVRMLALPAFRLG